MSAKSVPLPVEVRRLVRAAFLASGAVFAFLLYSLYFRPAAASVPEWTAGLPSLNAAFNAAAATLVCLGVLAIRAGRRRLHAGLLIAALVCGAGFLAGYGIYHYYRGDTPYPGTGLLRPVYFFTLITHILASAAALPLVLTTALLAAARRFPFHRRWARVTVPVWLCASLTGLVVYAMLYS